MRTKDEIAFRIARAAEDAGLGVCVLRGCEAFPRLGGFDLDLLVPWRARVRFERVLREASDQEGWRILRVARQGQRTTHLLAARDAVPGDDRSFLQVDSHAALTARGVPFAAAREIVARSETEHGVRWLAPGDAALVAYLEPLLGGRPVKPAYAQDWDRVRRSAPERVRPVLDAALGRRRAGTIMQGGTNSLHALRRSSWRQACLRRPGETLRVLGVRLAGLVVSYLDPPGVLWSVSGPDGAGKTAVLDRLQGLAERRLAVGVDRFHTRPYLIPRLGRILPLGSARRDSILTRRGREPRIGRLKSAFRLALTVADFQIGYWLRVRPRLARGRLVLFDRYFEDYLVDPEIRGIRLPGGLLRAAALLVPRPSLRAFLLATPAALRLRKGELSEEDAARQAAGYRSLAERDHGAVIVETDAASSEEIARRLAGRLLEAGQAASDLAARPAAGGVAR